MKRKYLKGIGILIGGAVAMLMVASCFMLNYALSPENRGKDLQGSWEYMTTTYPELKAWKDSLQLTSALKDTFIYNADHIKLHAYYASAPQPTTKTAVIIHGYTDNAIRMMMIGYLYNHELGYNILLPDLQYSGESEGDAFQMGWFDRNDVMQWMDVANQIYGGNTQMVIHGISMGGATTMMIAGEPQPEYVKCFVDDCGYTSVWNQFGKELKEQFGMSEFPLLYTSSWLCGILNGWTFQEASSLKQVKKSHLPMLFIHGNADDVVPVEMAYACYEACTTDKELVIVDGCPHARAHYHAREQYMNAVKSFVGKHK